MSSPPWRVCSRQCNHRAYPLRRPKQRLSPFPPTGPDPVHNWLDPVFRTHTRGIRAVLIEDVGTGLGIDSLPNEGGRWPARDPRCGRRQPRCLALRRTDQSSLSTEHDRPHCEPDSSLCFLGLATDLEC